MNSKEMTKLIVDALEDKKALDVKIINIEGISLLADYFIVASASNQSQLVAMQDAADEAMYKNGIHALSIEGNRNSTWILMDYQDVIVHLFSEEDRLFYNLERIWQDGKVVSKDEL